VAKRFFPREDSELVSAVQKLDPSALEDKPAPPAGDDSKAAPQEIPNSVNWRGRKANIVDASIGQALANVSSAEAKLRTFLSSNSASSPREKAAAYDDVLIASQDAADATKRATDELEKERVDEGDARMQDLRVTSLSVNFDLVSWRVGRNRVLIGEDDGLTFGAQQSKKSKRLRKDGTPYPEQEEPRGRKLARLRERNVLYDATIQSVNSIKDLRGAMRDPNFVEELDGKVDYFRALKCLNISYSHSLLGNHLNALALLKRAQQLVSRPAPAAGSSANGGPPTLDLQPAVFDKLKTHVESLASRMHAIVEMHSLEANSAKAAEKHMSSAAPIVQRLNDYPTPGTMVDLTNLVTYPPRIEAVPVKPLFLDVAFNYIDYPGRTAHDEEPQAMQQQKQINGTEPEVADEKSAQPAPRKGWFGFGR
jgi:signal recognition particle subunit SRP68